MLKALPHLLPRVSGRRLVAAIALVAALSVVGVLVWLQEKDKPSWVAAPVLSVITTTPTSIEFTVWNTNTFRVETHCQMSPNRESTDLGWHTIGGVSALRGETGTTVSRSQLVSDYEYRFRCRFVRPGFPGVSSDIGTTRGRTS